MQCDLFLNASFEAAFSSYNLPETLVLSTSNRRYRNSACYVLQCSEKKCEDLFTSALDSFYATTIIIDLFDVWTQTAPSALRDFLEAYGRDAFPDSDLIIIIEDQALIPKWGLEYAKRHF